MAYLLPLTPVSGVVRYLGSRSHLKIRFAFTICRSATSAADMPPCDVGQRFQQDSGFVDLVGKCRADNVEPVAFADRALAVERRVICRTPKKWPKKRTACRSIFAIGKNCNLAKSDDRGLEAPAGYRSSGAIART